MKILLNRLCIGAALLGMSASAIAQQSSDAKTTASATESSSAAPIQQLSASAAKSLAKSTEELSKLRDQIASEKLPLAQELADKEEQLAKKRTEYEKITRLVDAGNLGIITLKTEIKARQDELAYVGNLLDEYARSFETKINVSELQYCKEAIETSKQASENTGLTLPEKLAKQTALVDLALKRMADSIGGMTFPGHAVDMQGVVEEGQFSIIGPVALFRANTGATAGLVIAQSGSTNPLVRPLDGELQTGLVSLVQKGEGFLPLDPSRGGALKALVQKTDPVQIFKKGGPIMYPLLLCATLSVLTVLERLFFLLNEKRKRDPRALENFFAAIGSGDSAKAVAISNKSKYYLVRALGYALAHKEKSLANALMYAQEKELKRFRRGIPMLDTVITLAPLLGLLGTVTGMMGSFSLIGGDLSSPGAITGGIAEALIATAFGLTIAITSLIPFNFLNNKMEEARIEIETAATQLELLVHPSEIHAEAEEQDEYAMATSS